MPAWEFQAIEASTHGRTLVVVLVEARLLAAANTKMLALASIPLLPFMITWRRRDRAVWAKLQY